MKDLSPLLLFLYKRVEYIDAIISSLLSSPLSKKTDLFIFVDGPKCENDILLISSVCNFINNISGFKSITINHSEINKGLAESIISGVGSVIPKYKKVIVLEDDLIPSSNFLEYMNSALIFYKSNQDIYSISAFDLVGNNSALHKDAYFLQRSWPWGWATWFDRWEQVDWDLDDYHIFLNNKNLHRKFNYFGSDLAQMLIRQISGELDSWSIRWTYHIYKKNGFVVYPKISKINNMGWDEYATNTVGLDRRYKRIIDMSFKTNFSFEENIIVDKTDAIMLSKKFNILNRAYNKFLEYFITQKTIK